MRYWDTSALIPLMLQESFTGTLAPLAQADEGMVVWWATSVEVTSALVRRVWAGGITGAEEQQARLILRALSDNWLEMRPTERLRGLAERLLSAHRLRAGDALQLAAALRWAESLPHGELFVCLDLRLRGAAAREGFRVLPETGMLESP